MLSFKPTFPLSSFTVIKRLFSSSSLSVIRVVSSAYLRLLIFFLAILIPACASSSPVFLMMYSAYKLNNQGDNILPWRIPFLIWNQSVVPSLALTAASWPAYRFLRRQVRWSGSPISWRVFQFVVIHSQRLQCSQQSRYFSGILLLFLWSNGCWQFDLWLFWLFSSPIKYFQMTWDVGKVLPRGLKGDSKTRMLTEVGGLGVCGFSLAGGPWGYSEGFGLQSLTVGFSF